MPKAKTTSFIFELPLQVNPQQEKALKKRLNAARMLYNACLCECLKRAKKLKQSDLYFQAKHLPAKVTIKGKQKVNQERKELFKQSREETEFSEYDLHGFSKGIRANSHFSDHIDAFTEQKIMTRAYQATNKYVMRSDGKGRPRFKGINQLDSVEGKSNGAGIRFVDGRIVWSKLELIPIFDNKDKYWVESHALACKTKYVRLLRREIKGRYRYFAQLVQEGYPLIKEKNAMGKGVIGLDLGPSLIAGVSEKKAFLNEFCTELNNVNKKVKKVQRKIERSRRLTNPDNYEPNFIKINANGNKIKKKGKVIKGAKKFIKSGRYLKKKIIATEANRKLAAYRKTLQGQLVNQVLTMGNDIRLEKINYRAWQKMFGKSVGHHAPGMFVSILKRKAESAGGSVTEVPVKHRLSQTCHCGSVEKKSLSARWHSCEKCNAYAQRDLYSAFLARFADAKDLNIHQAQKAWSAQESVLCRAMFELKETAKRRKFPSCFGLKEMDIQRLSGLHDEAESNQVEALPLFDFAIKSAKRGLASCQ
jgi:putative transposase